jgi:hypothetical protein
LMEIISMPAGQTGAWNVKTLVSGDAMEHHKFTIEYYKAK